MTVTKRNHPKLPHVKVAFFSVPLLKRRVWEGRSKVKVERVALILCNFSGSTIKLASALRNDVSLVPEGHNRALQVNTLT